MSKEFVKAALREDAESHVPAHPDLWPSIAKRVHVTNRPQSRIPRLRLAFNPRPLLMAGALALLLISLWSIATFTQPVRTVSAEEIVARAAQVLTEEPGAGLRTFHGVYTFRYRHDPNSAFAEQREETWFQTPARYARVTSNPYSNGQDSAWFYGIEDGFTYQHAPGLNYIQMADLAFFHMQDPTTTTLKIRPFSPTSLESVLEVARRKLPPPLNGKSDPRPPYMYEVKLMGEEQVLDRSAYVVEMTLVPGASLQSPNMQVPEKMKMWVDKELYAVLRIEGWNAEGVVLQSGVYTSFEVNGNTQFDVLNTLAPSGTDIVDIRPVPDAATLDKGWLEATQRAAYTVFKPSRSLDSLMPGRPFYNSRREVISQQYQGHATLDMQSVVEVFPAVATPDPEWSVRGAKPKEVTLTKLIITQGLPSSIKADDMGNAVPVHVANHQGFFYSQDGANTLIFDRDGTRIKLSSSPFFGVEALTSEQLVQIAETLQPVEKK
jgi:hypothetical protein